MNKKLIALAVAAALRLADQGRPPLHHRIGDRVEAVLIERGRERASDRFALDARVGTVDTI